MYFSNTITIGAFVKPTLRLLPQLSLAFRRDGFAFKVVARGYQKDTAVDFFGHHKALVGMVLLILLSFVLKQFGVGWLDPEIIIRGARTFLEEQTNECAVAETHWKSAEKDGTLAAFKAHLARFPNCSFADLAKLKIQEMEGSATSSSGVSEADGKLAPPNETDEELVRRVYKHVGPSNTDGYIPPGFHITHQQ